MCKRTKLDQSLVEMEARDLDTNYRRDEHRGARKGRGGSRHSDTIGMHTTCNGDRLQPSV